MFDFLKRTEKALQERLVILETRVTRLTDQAYALEDDNHTLTVENEKLSQKKQMDDEMIAHKIKMREEAMTLDSAKKISEAERKAAKGMDEGIAKTKDKYRDKLENQLEKRGNEMKEMYSEILTRLPDVTMAISKEIKQKS